MKKIAYLLTPESHALQGDDEPKHGNSFLRKPCYLVVGVGVCLAVLAVLGSGCATTKRTNLLSLGMDRREVMEIMGTPASSKRINNREVLEYVLYPTWHSTWQDRVYFRVTLEDGRVVTYGSVQYFRTATPQDKGVYIIKSPPSRRSRR